MVPLYTRGTQKLWLELKAALGTVHHMDYFIIDKPLRRKRLTLDLYSGCLRRLSLNISDWVYQQCVTGEQKWKLYPELSIFVEEKMTPASTGDILRDRHFCNMILYIAPFFARLSMIELHANSKFLHTRVLLINNF